MVVAVRSLVTSDMGIRLSITLEEAAAGVTKTISYSRLSTCDDVMAPALGEGGKIEDCPRCHLWAR